MTDEPYTPHPSRDRAVALAAAIWTVAVPLLGHRLIVTGGPPGRETLEVGLAPVMIITLAAALAGWALLALLQRLLPRIARRIWTITAVAVLLVSFAPLLAPGMDATTRITLDALHVAVAAVLVPAMSRIAAHPAPPPPEKAHDHHPEPHHRARSRQ